MNEPHEVLSFGLADEQREGRIWGFVEGVVTNVNDDAGLGRVRARIAALGDNEESDWLVPAWPGSIEALPAKGEPVLVGFVDGDPHRGVWWWHPISTSTNRPTEAAVLGSTMAAMWNYFRAQFQQLANDFNNHSHSVSGAGTSCAAAGSPWTGTATSGTPSATSAQLPGQMKAADGSVPSKSGDQVVLSGTIKVR